MLNINLSVIYNIINIIVLFLLLKKFLFKPVTDIMEKRKSLIEGALKDADNSKNEAAELKNQYETALKNAKNEAVTIVKDAKVRAEAEYEKKIELADKDAKTIVENASKAVELEKEKAVRSAKNEISSLAIAAASKIVEKETDNESNKKLLDDFLSEAGGAK